MAITESYNCLELRRQRRYYFGYSQKSHNSKNFQTRLNAKVTSLDEQVAATRNDLLEFSAQEQETLNHITGQLSELIAYINRGGNDKKGEVSSSRPQPPPDDQNRGSGNTRGGSGARTTDIVEIYSGSLSREGRGSGGSRSRGHSKKRYPSSGGGQFRRSFDDWLG
ncbi:hypothetical protein F511_41032 [Dorcoceras hygrometricum]|uniref:Uncharacterized protein n=1 Tax=Dorcoceras hygrometricum TaxID=472368 RepID=A0A2Z7BU68_9LAMI|nr:hypothetical protein F511_41032 [Dorcoceras hygrometricum]